MRDHSRLRSPACVRGEGVGAVPVRAPDPDLPAPQPVPGAARRGLLCLAGHRLPRHQRLHAPDRPGSPSLCTDGGGPGPHGPADRRRHPILQCWSWKGHPELDLRQAQDHGTERPGRLHPLRPTGLGLRPPGRMHARRSGPAPQRPARRPRHRPTRRDTTTQAHWRQGVHRTGNDHPEKKTPHTYLFTPTTRPTTGPSTRSATRSSKSSPTSKHGESCTPATEDH